MSALPKPFTKPVLATIFFDRLIDVMEEEPARVDQTDWLEQDQCSLEFKKEVGEIAAVPACGTVGCTAGWSAILLGYKRFPGSEVVADQLGLQLVQTEHSDLVDDLFHHQGYNKNVFEKPGTRDHMRKVVGGIRTFVKEHRNSLKRIVIYPKGTK